MKKLILISFLIVNLLVSLIPIIIFAQNPTPEELEEERRLEQIQLEHQDENLRKMGMDDLTNNANNASEDAVLQNPLNPGGKNSNFGINNIAQNIIKFAIGITGVLALVAFIYGGFMWLISAGDQNKITKGKNIMTWAVFGLAVIFASYAVVTTIFTALGVK